jgi:chromosome segregation ATPase
MSTTNLIAELLWYATRLERDWSRMAALLRDAAAELSHRDKRIAELEAKLHDNMLIADGAYDRADAAVAENKRLGENARTAIDAGEVIIGTLRAEKKAAEARAEKAEAALADDQATCWRPARDIAELRTVIAARDKRIAELEQKLRSTK